MNGHTKIRNEMKDKSNKTTSNAKTAYKISYAKP